MKEKIPCGTPLKNPHYWVMEEEVWIPEVRKGKLHQIRYQRGRCQKCKETRLFRDYAVIERQKDEVVEVEM